MRRDLHFEQRHRREKIKARVAELERKIVERTVEII
jgi:hypothetical protein